MLADHLIVATTRAPPTANRSYDGIVMPTIYCGFPACRTDAIALRSAWALLLVSSHSRSGTESETIPAPACTEATPSAMMQVRIVIARSIRFPPAAMYPIAPAYGPRDA